MIKCFKLFMYNFRVILCNGLNYPPVQPHPVMSTLSLSLPLCDPQTEKTTVEVTILLTTTSSLYHFIGTILRRIVYPTSWSVTLTC